MKFNKLLDKAKEGFPDADGMFLRYKELKKQLKAMKKGPATDAGKVKGPRQGGNVSNSGRPLVVCCKVAPAVQAQFQWGGN
jgi:hypothetical protein